MAEPATRPLTVAQLAERWGCDENTIYGLIRTGQLHHFRIGKLIRIRQEVVDGKALADFDVKAKPRWGNRLAKAILRAIGPEADRSRGCVYFIKSGRYVKIGYSERTANGRLLDFLGVNPDVSLLGSISGTRVTERFFHDTFREWRHRNEWFHLDRALLSTIKAICK